MIKTLSILILFSSVFSLMAQVNPVTTYNNSYTGSSKKTVKSGTGKSIEVTPFIGYQLNGRIDFIEGDFKMDNAMSYGGTVSVGVGHNVFGEFSYSRSDTIRYIP